MIIKKKSKLNSEMQAEQVEETLTAAQDVQGADSVGEIDLFNLDNIDFKQRQERRRGDRRRGFRRIDDRNLISRAREEANSIREAAAKEGYQQGLQEARADIEQFKEITTIISDNNSKKEILRKAMYLNKIYPMIESNMNKELLFEKILVDFKGMKE